MPKSRELSDKEKILQSAVQIGVDQADKGEFVPLAQEVIDDVKLRGRQRRAARKPGKRG